MTANRGHPDVRLLAALDAGLLDEATAREVRAAAEADPASRAVLDALAATRVELAAHPDPPVPPAHDHRHLGQLGPVPDGHGREEGIHVHMQDGAFSRHGRILPRSDLQPMVRHQAAAGRGTSDAASKTSPALSLVKKPR